MEQTRVKAGHIVLVQGQNIQTCETDALDTVCALVQN